ncbi:MAG: Tricarboxylate transport protein TctC [Betaproteobacteria bacterium]|nr:Tricarboxylate transport protein TctC [Betaproteobacteria bacterium]
MRLIHAVSAFLFPCCALLPALGHAQDYPARPVRVLIGTVPGGAVDIVGRLIAPKLAQALGQPFVVENHPGPYTAQKMIAEALPDGYTLMITSTTITTTPGLYPKADLNPSRDATAVAMVADTPIVLMFRPGFKPRTVQEAVALAKSEPGVLTYASAGSGSPPHLAAELFKAGVKADILHVPYKGVNPALIDVAAGRVDMMFASYGSAIPFIKGGKLVPVATINAKRFSQMPDLPTLKELGYADIAFGSWVGLIAPPRTPGAIVNILNREVVKAAADKTVVGTLTDQGFTPAAGSSRAYADMIREDTEMITKLIQKSAIKPN